MVRIRTKQRTHFGAYTTQETTFKKNNVRTYNDNHLQTYDAYDILTGKTYTEDEPIRRYNKQWLQTVVRRVPFTPHPNQSLAQHTHNCTTYTLTNMASKHQIYPNTTCSSNVQPLHTSHIHQVYKRHRQTICLHSDISHSRTIFYRHVLHQMKRSKTIYTTNYLTQI